VRGSVAIPAGASISALLTVACAAQTAPTSTPLPSRTPAVATNAEALRARLAPLVLQLDDLSAIGKPADYQQFDEGPQLRADMPGGSRSDPARFGRLGGWKSRYRVADPTATGIAFSIESRVDLFADPSGPVADLQALAQDAPRTGARVTPVTRPIGEASVGLVNEQAAPRSIGYYTVAWRRGSILASIVVSGFKEVVALEQATMLAEAVDRRIVREGG
jgi:hypothetical protein